MRCIRTICSFLLFTIVLTVGYGSAIAEDVQIVADLYPEGASATGNPVTLSMKGKNYPTDAWFNEMVRSGKATPDEKFVMDAVTINTNGTLSDVRKLWTTDEQNTSFFSDPSVFARSQAFLRRITGAAFLAKIRYGNYLIFLVQADVEGYGSVVNRFPVKKQNGRFYITNELGDDPVFIYFLEKYEKSLSFKKR